MYQNRRCTSEHKGKVQLLHRADFAAPCENASVNSGAQMQVP